MIIELKDKGIELEFPDDMPLDKIKSIIDTQFYGKGQVSPAANSMVDSPMPAVPPDVMGQWDQTLTEEAPVAGSMLPGPLGILGGGAGKAYQMMRTGETPQLPAWSDSIEPVPGGVPEAFPKPSNLMGSMGAGAVGLGAGKVAERALSPLANKAGQVGEWFQQEGLPRLGNRASRWMEELTGLSISGSTLANKYTQQLQNWARNERIDILKSISQDIKIPSEIGQDVGKQVLNIFKEPKQLYGDFARLEGKIPISNGAARVAHKWMEYVDPGDQAILKRIIEQDRNFTAEEVSKLLGGKRLGIKNDGLRNELKDAIGKDLEAVDALQGTYFKMTRDLANEAYTELSKQWANNPRALAILHEYEPSFGLKVGGETVLKPSPFYSSRPEGVIDKMFKTGKPEELIQLKESMPKELWDGALASWLEQKFLATDSYNPQTRMFNPWAWSEGNKTTAGWNKVRNIMLEVEPEVAKRIDKFTEMTIQIKEQLTKEVPTFVQQVKKFALPVAGAGLGFAGAIPLWTIPVADGFAGLMAWGFLGPTGKGSLASLAKKGAKLGTVEGLVEFGEPDNHQE